ncbi:DUF805 domain-containing protein [Octadecabacter sp. SW4]|nr:DUF805 domain-containing protein [Octadecabacter sp. SW4]
MVCLWQNGRVGRCPAYRPGGSVLMGPREAIISGFSNVLQFSGRTSPFEFWWFFGLVSLVAFILLLPWLEFFEVDTLGYTRISQSFVSGEIDQTFVVEQRWRPASLIYTPVSLLIVVAFFATLASAVARRCHDVGASGWFAVAMFGSGPILVLLLGLAIPMLFPLAPKLTGLLIAFSTIPLLICQWVLPLAGLIRRSRPSEEGTTEFGPNPNEVPS